MARLSDAAVALAQAGWPVFPVSRTDKHPLTTHGHLDATTSVRQVLQWADRFDSGAIATPTGGPHKLLVVDVDPRNGGIIPQWCPPTRTVRTQSGGTHLHYKLMDGEVKSRAEAFGPGVDSKSAGGYVLLPPSPGYKWLDTRERTVLPVALVEAHMVLPTTAGGGAARLAPEQWRRGIIHDQVVAWAAYFAGELDDEDEVTEAVWTMVNQAQRAGVRIDNARDHIGAAIRWVLAREASSDAPSLG